MDFSYIIIHYSEIGLKGGNRPFFQRILQERIESVLPPSCTLTLVSQRYIVRCGDAAATSAILESLNRVFGIAWFSSAFHVNPNIEDIEKGIDEKGRELLGNAKTFRMTTMRADKSFPLTSQGVDERIGERVVKKFGTKVDLARPDKNIHIEIIPKAVYIYAERCEGLRGLPVGSSGKVLSLFSGGIDSPVSTLLMMKRGCECVCIHFHAFRSIEELKGSKVEKLFKIIASYGGPIRVFYVPFFHFHASIVEADPRYELLLFRRFIVKTSEEIARQEGYSALVMGDNLGQVASQTLSYLELTDRDVALPILRPLISHTKEEIIDIAKRFGTYEPSIEDYKDCCSIVSAHPTLEPKHDILEALEKKINSSEIIEKSIQGITERTYDEVR